MNGSGLTASDVMALTKDNDGMFGGVGGFILLFIFLMAISGNGFGFGNNNVVNALGQSDLQNSLYFQSQDAAIRGLAQGQCNIIDSALNNKYDNAVLIRDLSNQMSNSVAAIGNQIANQTAVITNLFNEQTIDRLRDTLATTRDELSNVKQTGIITNAISNQTSEILNAQGRYYLNPPCYQGCGCGASCNGLY